MTQAFTSPITSRLKGGLFNPLEFNPYLLFDAQTSMLGELEAPTLDLDASDESTLDVITATRAGVATYTDLHGVIKTASADTVRVDWSLGYPAMLIEPSATNLVENSSINSEWYPYSNPVTIEEYSGDSGALEAYVLSRVGDNEKTSIQHGYISGGATTDATASLFYKHTGEARFFQFWDTNLSNSQYVNVDTLTDEVNESDGSASITVLGDGWRRLEWTRPDNTANSVGYMRLSLCDSLTSGRNPVFSGTGGIAFAGFQLEAGSVATSYIPTSGSAVTRNADNLVIDGTDFSDFYNQTEGTVYVEAVPQDGVNDYPYYFEFSGASSADTHYTYRNGTSSNYFAAYSGGSAVYNASIGSVTLDALNRISYSYKQNDNLGSSNGATPNLKLGTVPTGILKLLIGNSVATTPRLMTGRIKRLLYWPTHSSSL